MPPETGFVGTPVMVTAGSTLCTVIATGVASDAAVPAVIRRRTTYTPLSSGVKSKVGAEPAPKDAPFFVTDHAKIRLSELMMSLIVAVAWIGVPSSPVAETLIAAN